MTRQPGLRPALLALGGFTLLAVAWSWPLAAHLSTRLPHDPDDPVLNTWILWWNVQAVPFTAPWWNAPVMFPVPGALALSEHLAGLALFSTPVLLLGGTPAAAYNVCLLASAALSGWFAFLLAERLTGSRLAAAGAGLAFLAAPYRAGQLGHLQVLAAQWLPALLLGLHGYLESGRARWLWLAGAAWVLNGLSNGYYLLFTPVLVALWLAWFVDWRRAPRRGLAIGATLALASLALLPALIEYRSVHAAFGLARTTEEMARYSATVSSFTNAPPLLAAWPSRPAATTETFLFPGVTAPLLVLSALGLSVIRRQGSPSALHFYAAAALAMYLCALGPGAPGEGLLAFARPYRWLSVLPGYHSLRVPARFAMPGALCLAVAAGLALARLAPRGRAAWTLGAVALAGIAVDGWMRPLPLVVPPPRMVLESPRDRPVLELPPDDARVSVAAMYRSIWHRRPLVNLYSGHIAPHYAILSHALRRGDLSPLRVLSRPHGLTVVVNGQSGAEFAPLVASVPGAQSAIAGSAGAVFELPAAPAPAPIRAGTALPATARDAGAERLVLDLGGARRVDALTFDLRWRYLELPERMLVECSEDGMTWQEAWRDWTGEAAFAGALADPQRVPVSLPLGGTRARYVRIYPAPQWLAGDVRVMGG